MKALGDLAGTVTSREIAAYPRAGNRGLAAGVQSLQLSGRLLLERGAAALGILLDATSR